MDAYFQMLDQFLCDFPACLVINFGETGDQAWIDGHAEGIIVPSKYKRNTLCVPVSRSSRRLMLLGAIMADGGFLKRLVIVGLETCETELFQLHHTPDRVLYVSQDNGFISSDLFESWTQAVLFPYIEEIYGRLRNNGEAVVLLDRSICHETDFSFDECTCNGVIPLFLPPHSSNQPQPQDLGTFGVQKSKASKIQSSTHFYS
jgi:hypothetical protein